MGWIDSEKETKKKPFKIPESMFFCYINFNLKCVWLLDAVSLNKNDTKVTQSKELKQKCVSPLFLLVISKI